MTEFALVQVFCPDRTGLIAAITGRLFDLGINLADTTFAVLGAGAELAAVCELPPDMTCAEVEAELRALPELAGAEIEVTPFGLATAHGPSGTVTHRIMVQGGDRPGLIARLCETFVGFNANVVRLNSEKAPSADNDAPVYLIHMAVAIPAEAADACLATVANTAQTLGLECGWEAVSRS